MKRDKQEFAWSVAFGTIILGILNIISWGAAIFILFLLLSLFVDFGGSNAADPN